MELGADGTSNLQPSRISCGSNGAVTTYATFALINDGMDIHTLAIQMGTSIGMIERHYSHLTPRLKKDMLTGRRYDVPKGGV